MLVSASDILNRYGLGAEAPRASTFTFPDGSHFGLELSSANTPEVIEQMLDLARRFDLRINRFIECRGISRLTDFDISAMVNLCTEAGAGLFLSIGSRATYGTGAFSRSSNGARQGYRAVGRRGLLRGVEEVVRASELGVRGFLIYDEGMLDVLGRARQDGLLAPDILFKFSVHAGCSNPASARLMERLGADCINPVPDLSLEEISEMRSAVTCPLDLFTDTAADAGGLLRTHDVPEFVRLASPVYLKCGPISQNHQNHLPSQAELIERVRQTRCVLESLGRCGSDFRQVSDDASLALPRPNLARL